MRTITRTGAAEVRPPAPRAQKLKIRAASLADYEQIAALESRGGIRPRSYAKWAHLWLDNPLYRELQPGWNIGWVAENEDKRIVASVGNIPLPYHFRGKRIVAASGRALVSDPDYGSAALFLLGRVVNQPGVDLYLNNTMSPTAAESFTAFECPRVPAGRWDESAFWITGYRGFVKSLLARQGRPFAGPLSYPLSVAAFLGDRVRRKALREAEVQACSQFDDRFDAFWEALVANNPHLLLAARTRPALEWHYRYALAGNRLWIAAVNDGPRLAAYAVFYRKDNARLDLKRVWLVDFQSLDGSPALLAPLLSWGLKQCRKQGVHMLESIGRWLEPGEFIGAVAPHRRKLSTWTYYYHAGRPELAESLEDRRAWSGACSYDGDATL
jgi:hypothetical protein